MTWPSPEPPGTVDMDARSSALRDGKPGGQRAGRSVQSVGVAPARRAAIQRCPKAPATLWPGRCDGPETSSAAVAGNKAQLRRVPDSVR